MFTHNINPILLNLGPLQIRWYGLFFVIGFILAYYILKHLSVTKKISWKVKDIENLLVYAGVGGVIGARLFYVLVYNFSFYLQDPLTIFAVWQGGLSFHGSLIGAIVGLYLFSKKYKFNFLEVLDYSALPFALGLALGRIGNFINGELPGRPTDVPWCVDFGEGCRHPSQIYSSIKNFLIFGILWILKDGKLKKGMLAASFIILYSLFRFLVGFFRAPDVQIGYIGFLTLGQILNIIMFISGLIFFYALKHKFINRE